MNAKSESYNVRFPGCVTPPGLERPFPLSCREAENSLPAVMLPVRMAQLDGDQVNAVSGRDLHTFLEVGKHFSTWMPEQIEAFGFVEHQDFEVLPEFGFNPQGGRPAKTYMISLPMAKELAMVQRSAKGKEARLYFIECERKAVSSVHQFTVPQTLHEALKLAAETEERRLATEEQRASLACHIAELLPKAAAQDLLFNDTDGALSLRDAAKVFKLGPVRFNRILAVMGWIYPLEPARGWTATQKKINSAYLRHDLVSFRNREGLVRVKNQAKVTRKGMAKLALIFGKQILASLPPVKPPCASTRV